MAETKERILVVEDDEALRELLVDEVSDAGFQFRSAGTVRDASGIVHEWSPDLVISDVRLPGGSGITLLEHVRTIDSPPAFIVITAFGTVPQAVKALKSGADDFLTKPLDLEHLMVSVERALQTRRLRKEVSRYRKLMNNDHFRGMLGQSPVMRSLFDHIQQIAKASGPVLIVGESGVGKELVARSIHAESNRSKKPFTAVNCAGIPGELLESEFFGHEEGAFTGADKPRKGLFTEADGGVLFLDEIGEMPMHLQSKLLRVLQDGIVRPVGSSEEHKVDVRVIAATNQDLEEKIETGSFREDLFYRLETFTIRVPPLRERGQEDIELLAGRLINRFSAANEKQIEGFSESALQTLLSYSFPGNIRELENAIERAVVFCKGNQIAPDDLPRRIRSAHNGTLPVTPDEPITHGLLGNDGLPSLEELENRYIHFVLKKVDGNKRRAAALLGIGRRTLYRKLEKEEK